MDTVAPLRKLVPVTVTLVAPAVLPAFGETWVTVGAPVTAVYVKRSEVLVADWPAGVETVTSTVPAAPDGLTAAMDVDELTTTLELEVVPNLTTAPGAKLVPDMVTDVPPVAVPEVGEIEVTVGGP
jgi:hypothetical protein